MACNQGQVCIQFNQITLKPHAGHCESTERVKKIAKPKPCYMENREQKKLRK